MLAAVYYGTCYLFFCAFLESLYPVAATRTLYINMLVKGYRIKSLKDISRYLLLLILAGATLWLIYGFAVGDVFIIGTNVAAIALMLTVYIMKKRYDDERRWTENISSA